MDRLLLTLLVMSACLWSYLFGSLLPATRDVTTTEHDAIQYMVKHDRGCNDIVSTERGLVCEIPLAQEDDAIFIVRLTGAKDDYEN